MNDKFMNRIAKMLIRIAGDLKEIDSRRKDAASNFVQVTLANFRESAKEAVEARFQKAADATGRGIESYEGTIKKEQDEIEELIDKIGSKIYNACWKAPEELGGLRSELQKVMNRVWDLVGSGSYTAEVKKANDAVWSQSKKSIFI